MKKLLALLAALVLALTMPCASLAQAEGDADILQKLYEANIYDALLERFDSVLTVFPYMGLHTIYVDAEFAYIRYSTGNATLYARDGSLHYSRKDDAYVLGIHIDDKIPGSVYSLGLLTASTVDEPLIDAQTADGLLTITTEMLEQDIESAITMLGTTLSDGDRVLLEYITDADTYALRQINCVIVRADGSRETHTDALYTYNAEMPDHGAALKARATETDKPCNITLTFDPGTDFERVCRAKGALDEYMDVYHPAYYQRAYANPECTEVYNPITNDGKDISLYFKIDVTLDTIIKANGLDELLEHYGSFKTSVESERAADPTSDYSSYYDSDISLLRENGADHLFLNDGTHYIKYEGDVYRPVYIGIAPYQVDRKYVLVGAGTEDEPVTDARRLDDCKLLLTTEFTEENAIAGVAHMSPSIEKFKFIYTIDPNYLTILSCESELLNADGSVSHDRLNIEYGAARPNVADELWAYATATENVQTITYILDAGTAGEIIYPVTVVKGVYVNLYCGNNVEQVLYEDPKCTIPHEWRDDADGITLYLHTLTPDGEYQAKR